MYRTLVDEVTRCAEQVRFRDVLRKREAHLAQELADKREERSRAAEAFQAENRDVEQLESASFSRLFARVAGNLDDKLHTERAKAQMARMRLIELTQLVETLQTALDHTRLQLREIGDVDGTYRAALKHKTQTLLTNDDATAQTLSSLLDQIAAAASIDKELSEAATVGRQTLRALDVGLLHLSEASSWDAWDMLGGGGLVTVAKHGKLDEASRALVSAKALFRRFQHEVADVQQVLAVRTDLSSVMAKADIFLDGLFVDWLRRARTENSAQPLRRARESVAKAVDSLQHQRASNVSRLARLRKSFRTMVLES